MYAPKPACGRLAQALRRPREKICLEKTQAVVFVRSAAVHSDENFIIDQIGPDRTA
jgi:hypothetical protein